MLAARGRDATGIQGVLASDVPIGAGLSSSAALTVASAVALCAVADFELPPREFAEICRAAEESATGVRGGIMDQLTSICGRAGHALLIDCRSLDVQPVPMPRGIAVLVVHSGTSRRLDSSGYSARRKACEETAAALGIPALRDATAEQVADIPHARHVVSENTRVHATADALARSDLAELGRLLVESHVSLRDDYEVSTPALDALVEELVAAGAAGARLTGAGFGGCVVAVVDAARVDDIAATATALYRDRTGLEPRAFVCRAVDGACTFEP